MNIEEVYVKNIYSQIADHFDNTRHYKWWWITEFIEKTELNSVILDMGCGNGRNMNYKRNMMGIDNCEQFITICKNKGLNVLLSDIVSTPFTTASFNYIINIAVFHHLENEYRRKKCLNEMYRLLKPKGKILISVWSKNQPEKTKKVFENYGDNYVEWKKDNEVYKRYYYIFQIEEIKKLFEETGFKIENYIWDCGNEIFILTK